MFEELLQNFEDLLNSEKFKKTIIINGEKIKISLLNHDENTNYTIQNSLINPKKLGSIFENLTHPNPNKNKNKYRNRNPNRNRNGTVYTPKKIVKSMVNYVIERNILINLSKKFDKLVLNKTTLSFQKQIEL